MVDFPIRELPEEITPADAVASVYADDLEWVETKLRQGVSVLLELDKQVVTWFYSALRARVRGARSGRRIVLHNCSGHSDRRRAGAEGEEENVADVREEERRGSRGRIQAMLAELSDLVRRSMEAREGETHIIVIPHIDLLATTTKSSLSLEVREVIASLYDNPDIIILGFKDPEFELPEVIGRIFTAKRSLIGIARDKMTQVITRNEARKFGERTFDPYSLYKFLSGVNAIRARQILAQFQDRSDFDPRNTTSRDRIIREIREQTVAGDLEIPKIDLDKDVGGYDDVKKRIKDEILTLLTTKDSKATREEVKAIEELIPRGMIFEGPPGTGKTYFAKAIATAIDATVIVVSGPELKSKWVGESEQNLRQKFLQARKSAPAVIIFDELDSFAVKRGSYQGSGVEHSMVNQLLTEMDGFRKEELVFVIGTTNFASSLDDALMRPGRFELVIEIPYPNERDRRAILDIYRKKYKLDMPEDVFDRFVHATGGWFNFERKMKFAGDHLAAKCKQLARNVIRNGSHTITWDEVEATLGGETFATEKRTDTLDRRIAVHEGGHAVAAAVLDPKSPPMKIVLDNRDEEQTSAGTFMKIKEEGERVSADSMRTRIAVSLAGRAAEREILGGISAGASMDLTQANDLAEIMVKVLGMSETLGPTTLFSMGPKGEMVPRNVSDETLKTADEEVRKIILEQDEVVAKLIKQRKDVVEALAAELIKKRVLESYEIEETLGKFGIKIDITPTKA